MCTKKKRVKGKNDGDAPVASISSSLIADNLDVRLTIPPINGMMRRTWITLGRECAWDGAGRGNV